MLIDGPRFAVLKDAELVLAVNGFCAWSFAALLAIETVTSPFPLHPVTATDLLLAPVPVTAASQPLAAVLELPLNVIAD